MISVVELGTVEYGQAVELQNSLVEARKGGTIGDTLLLLEHPPVITLGRSAERAHVLASKDLLQARGVAVFECNRGGDVTFHGPGQLVAYPIFDLRAAVAADGSRKTLGAVDFVRHLEEVMIRSCADFGVATVRKRGLTGVWTDAPAPAKIGAIGVHISRGVTSHGLALNVNTDLDYFKLIVPCGISDKDVTSLARETGNTLAVHEVAESMTRNFGRVFNSQILWVDTIDALLGRTVGVPARPPEREQTIAGEERVHWS